MKSHIKNDIQRLKKGVKMSFLFFLAVTTILVPSSCKKFIEVDPPFTRLSGDNVYTSDETAAAVLTDIYAFMSSENNTLTNPSITSTSLYLSLSADEFDLYDLNIPDLLDFYRNDLKTSTTPNYWETIYLQIFAVNNALEGLTKSTSLTAKIRKQLLGEAKFMRAFYYFHLVNMYGDVPLVLNVDYKANALLARAPAATVYQQVIQDLKEAQALLSPNYLMGDALSEYPFGQEERVRPTSWAAAALLARTYLYMGDYIHAEAAATVLINQSSLFSLTTLNETFLKNSKEAIWQLQPVGIDEQANTGEGKLFVLPETGPGPNNPVYLNNQLLNSFEIGDLRRASWINSVASGGSVYYYPFKYKIGNVAAPTEEYPTILRLAEQYLIRAEARAATNNLVGAQNDLNTIRNRAGLDDTNATNKTELLDAILTERQLELFTEWGHRWFDLKRSGRLNSVMATATSLKGGTWRPYQALFPIRQTEIDSDPNLSQNPGYN